MHGQGFNVRRDAGKKKVEKQNLGQEPRRCYQVRFGNKMVHPTQEPMPHINNNYIYNMYYIYIPCASAITFLFIPCKCWS